MKRTAIERLFRKELRELHLDPSREVFLVKTGTVEEKVVCSLLLHVFNGRVTIVLVPVTTRKRTNVFVPSSLENELVKGLREFLECAKGGPRFRPLLSSVPEQVILDYAKANGIAGKLLAPADDIRTLLDALQRRQPQTVHALRKSFALLKSPSAKRAKDL